MNYSKELLIKCLTNEYAHLLHDSEEPGDMTVEERREWFNTLSVEQLIGETGWDDEEDLKEFIENWKGEE
ncbi:hypothetical protein [Synechococcus sp. ROS8604]|uniref:hypothetical protein n=1 Tax=Synechococcus sp. ROS8604 TaxID=1442557 RepID=UPI001645290C|nr:hypothetical protein [Synechococcus sp. ROS8604]QNI87715.1 hypothetical protein SynROS8604_01072 [Synechococcus sp. ROS8604]